LDTLLKGYVVRKSGGSGRKSRVRPNGGEGSASDGRESQRTSQEGGQEKRARLQAPGPPLLTDGKKAKNVARGNMQTGRWGLYRSQERER